MIPVGEVGEQQRAVSWPSKNKTLDGKQGNLGLLDRLAEGAFRSETKS